MGCRVPADIAIAGFDDIMLAGVVSPALTTCHVPREEMGRLAASMLLDCIDKEMNSCGEIVVKPELVVREQSALSLVRMTSRFRRIGRYLGRKEVIDRREFSGFQL